MTNQHTDTDTDTDVRQENVQQYRALRRQYREFTGLSDFNEVVLLQLTLRNLSTTAENWINQAQFIVDTLQIEEASLDFEREYGCAYV